MLLFNVYLSICINMIHILFNITLPGGDGPCIHVRTSIDVRYLFVVFLLLYYLPVIFQPMIVRSGTIHKEWNY